ncbi:hypothetical protein I0P70_12705 [Pontibacter sp. FD36]|uniref:Kelch repeat-containing protein n=1 Tax=Pontibacter sp. FD36 TaxID=2789860 RepID=UPI0018A92C14|nr:hypothetical protein [Pontibacter sp. FD36]MBF8964108.1 hypothetical protein [Pontibacter sp. FD36]
MRKRSSFNADTPMYYIRRIIPVLTCLLLLAGCQKEADILPVKTQVSVTLEKAKMLHIADVALEARMETTSDQEVRYGFIISEFETPSLERGKVIEVGTARESTSYSHVYSRTDTGKTYHIRAFSQLKNNTVYSQTQVFKPVAPAIMGVSPAKISNLSPLTISTNLKDLNPDQHVAIYLDQHPLQVGARYKSHAGSVFQAELPQDLLAGSYTLSIQIDDVLITYKEQITVLPGKWVRVLDLPFNNWHSTTTFAYGDWVYALQFKSGKTEFFKQNYKTGDKVNLTPFGPQWFLKSPAIVVKHPYVHFLGGEEFNGGLSGETTAKHLVYNILNDSWSQEGDIPAAARVSAVSGVFEDKLYFGLGHDLPPSWSIGALKLKNDLWSYDLRTKQWKQLADFPQFGRSGCASFMVGPQLHIVGGNERTRTNKENWAYDVRSNSWTRKADYPGNGYTGFTGFSVDGAGYVGLGEIGVFATIDTRELYRTFFRYDRLADSWSSVSEFNGNVPINKYTTADRNLGLLIGTDGLYSSKSLPVYTFIP